MTNSQDSTDFVDLADRTHYKDNIEFTTAEMLSTFDSLSRNYLSLIDEHYKKHNQQFGNYILQKGLNMVCSVFELTLLYTNNLLITCNTVQRSILLFCEFVSQINHDKYNYLRLSIRDAVLFVYKKTIYRLDSSQCCLLTTTKEGQERHQLLDKHHLLISTFTKYFIEHSDASACIDLATLNKNIQRLNKKLIALSFHIDDDDKILYQIVTSIFDVLSVMCSTNIEQRNFDYANESILKLLSYIKNSLNKKADISSIVYKIQSRLYTRDIMELIEANKMDCVTKQLIKS